MCITEYDEERTMAEKISEGEHKRAVTVALTMLKNGESVEKTNLYSGLPIEEVIALSKQVKTVPV